ncbi:hypothetical protein A8990_107113 [Paenibacillus taihuensis]|uniref:Uncharacterized protein n=1 Tax=Paenibacillus taihuensis TaxID=1156355 RepID=A0A3D9S796_9BACL|nr:hypothetical protein [Paenibacillus taihuensis]REE89017.1 hypothetical protein A8990_107113 [Paenibacillus taihuensis]
MLDAIVEFLLELAAEGIVWFLLFNSWIWFVISGISWLLHNDARQVKQTLVNWPGFRIYLW